MRLHVPALCALLLLAAPHTLHADEGAWQASLLVNAASSGNLHAHQTRYITAAAAISTCAAAHPPTRMGAPGVFSLWTVDEAAGRPSVATLRSEGLLAPPSDGGPAWGDDADALDDALTACVAEALQAVEPAGAGEVYVSVELRPVAED